MSDEKENLIGTRVRFRADFYTTRIIRPRGWTGTIEEERRSSSGQGITSYIALLVEPFRSQEQDPREAGDFGTNTSGQQTLFTSVLPEEFSGG